MRAVAPDATIYVLNGFFADWAGHLSRRRPSPGAEHASTSIEAWARHCARSAVGDPRRHRHEPARPVAARGAGACRAGPSSWQPASPRLLMSHLACADEPGHPLNRAQLALFREIRGEFPRPSRLARQFRRHPSRRRLSTSTWCGRASRSTARISPQDRAPLATVVDARRRASCRSARRRPARRSATARAKRLDGRHADRHPLGRLCRRLSPAGGSSDEQPGASGARCAASGRRILGRVSMDLIAVDVTGIPGVSGGRLGRALRPEHADRRGRARPPARSATSS